MSVSTHQSNNLVPVNEIIEKSGVNDVSIMLRDVNKSERRSDAHCEKQRPRSLEAPMSSIASSRSTSGLSAFFSASSLHRSFFNRDQGSLTTTSMWKESGEGISLRNENVAIGKRTLRTKDQILTLKTQIEQFQALLKERIRSKEEMREHLAKTKDTLKNLEETLKEAEEAEESVRAENAQLNAQRQELQTKVLSLSAAAETVTMAAKKECHSSQVIYANYLRTVGENEDLKAKLRAL